MKNRTLLILLIFLSVVSCDEYDLTIETKYRTVINSYKLNDTIYFQSDQNPSELDTIRIKKVDSIRQYPTIGTVPPMKEIYLRIEHLPINKWKEATIAGTNKKRKNQPIITLANWNEECCQIRIRFREFESSIEKSSFDSEKRVDTLKRQNPLKITPDKIEEMYWSNETGIIGYKKFDGQVYRRKNAPQQRI